MILFSKYQKKLSPPPTSIWQNPIHFIGCGFGAGAFPYFPGTIGTLAAIPLVLLLAKTTLWFYIAACVVLFFIGIFLCGRINRDFGTDDHPAAVYDELSTFPVAMIAVPTHWYFLLIAFLLFRFFDIIKPGPIGFVDQHVHGGFGVMLDDLLASMATLVIMQLII